MQENILEIDSRGNGTELVVGLWPLQVTPKTLQQKGTGWLGRVVESQSRWFKCSDELQTWCAFKTPVFT